MAGPGPRRRKRDRQTGLPVAPPPTGVQPDQLAKPRHVADDPIASKTWDFVVQVLADRGDLRPAFAVAVALLSTEFARHVQAATLARQQPLIEDNRGIRSNPLNAVAAAAGRAAADLARDFALTPSSLARIDAPAVAGPAAASAADRDTVRSDDPDVDALEAFFLDNGSKEEVTRTTAEVLERRRRRR